MTLLEEHRASFSTRSNLQDWLESIAVALLVVLIFNLGFRVVAVNGASMEPTMQTGDRLIVSRIGYTPKRGDIIVSLQENAVEEAIIKRVIALENDMVDIDYEKGAVYVNGKEIDDSYTLDPFYIEELGARNMPITFPYTVPEGCVFVMGDNRNNSLDSRSQLIGPIEERYILGKAVFRMFPLNRMGVLQ